MIMGVGRAEPAFGDHDWLGVGLIIAHHSQDLIRLQLDLLEGLRQVFIRINVRFRVNQGLLSSPRQPSKLAIDGVWEFLTAGIEGTWIRFFLQSGEPPCRALRTDSLRPRSIRIGCRPGHRDPVTESSRVPEVVNRVGCCIGELGAASTHLVR